MPRPAKGARLFLRNRKGRPKVYVIKDTGGSEVSTGTGNRDEAEKILAEYIAAKHRPSGPAEPHDVTIAEVIAIYAEEHAQHVTSPERQGYAISALLPFWENLPLTAINGPTCRRYQIQRGVSAGTVRRELNVLQAALRYCAKEGYLTYAPTVALPDKPEPRTNWLTRDQIQTCLFACKIQKRRHLIPFIKTALWTGTRKSAILSLRIDEPNLYGGWIDTEQGILHRKGTGEKATKKRRSAAKAPVQLVRYARRLKTKGQRWMVEFQGNPVRDVKSGFAGLKTDTEIDVTPHTLKHTAITWAIQDGMTLEDASDYFATSVETIRSVYWHHSPMYQQRAVSIIENRSKR